MKSGNLNWRLFDFGGREANHHSAGALLDAALAHHDAVLQKMLSDVVLAYFDAQTAQATFSARQANEALAGRTLETTHNREMRGAAAQSDTLQAATAHAKASLETRRARGGYEKAVSLLAYTVGVPADTPLSLARDLDDPIDRMQQDLTGWLVQTQMRHPALLAVRAQLVSAQEKVRVTRSEGRPTLDLTGNYFQNARSGQGLMATRAKEMVVGVSLNIPVFDGFSRSYKVLGAQAQVEQKQAEARDTEQQVFLEVVKAYADASAALGNLAASQRLVTAAQDSLNSIQRKFDRGAGDILEMLGTQMALSDAELERVRCLAEWRSARLRLLASSGGLGLGDMRNE